MDMFNKLKSAVSNALPGNPMSKDFDIFGQIGTGGPGLLWKIYAGVKKTTKQDAAIFVFEKKSLEKYSRRDRELILETLKKGASQLTRLRHPKILSVMQPLEESRESLAFATEPVFASLSNVLGNHDNLPANVVKDLTEHKMYEVEIKYGLLQVTEALQFLHNDAKMLHSNICPESIMVNKNGSWKLAGFEFCIPNKNPPEQAPLFPFKDWDPDIVPLAQPHLDYLAPEFSISESCSLASDMFSVGVLIYSIFNVGKPLYECNHQLSAFKKNAEELRRWRGSLLGKIPEDLQEIVKLLLNTEPTVRPDPNQLAKVSFFEDVGSVTLQYMDSLFQQDNLQKSKFFKGLPKIIAKFPKRVNLQRILPPLLKECVNPDMIPFVLQNILQISEQVTDKEYVMYIFPDLIPMFKLVSPVQILLIFMQNMNLLLKKTPPADIKTHVLPMIYRALEADNPQIQELCLGIIPTFADMIDYTALKNAIIPRIKKLCLGTNIIGVRVNCLLCVGQLLEAMDKWFVLDEVLPMLPQIPSREPAVLMSILGIYRVTLSHPKLGITKELLAGKVLPFLVTLCTDNNLNLSQFNAYISLIKEMVEKIESDHRGKLEQLEQMKQEQKSIQVTKIEEYDEKTLVSGIEEKPKTMMDSFLSGFGLGSMTLGSGDGKKSTDQMSSADTKSQPTGAPPAKVSLTLEEKQRLAREQEQQRFLKAQKPLSTASSTSSSSPSLSAQKQSSGMGTNKPRDLTSSLMQSNMMGLSKPSYSGGNSANGLGGAGQSPSSMMSGARMTQPAFGSTMNSSNSYPQSNTMGQSSQSSFGASMSTNNSLNQGPRMGGSNKGMDLSSFDNLLSSSSSSQPKPVLNQMSSTGRSGPPQHGMLTGQGQSMMSSGPRGQNNSMMSAGMGGQGHLMSSGMGGQGHLMSSGMGGQTNSMMSSGMGGQGRPMMSSGMGSQGGHSMMSSNMPMHTGGFTGAPMMNSGFSSGNFQPQSNMGMQSNAFSSQPFGGQNMLQPQPMGNQNVSVTKNLSSNDLDDLLG